MNDFLDFFQSYKIESDVLEIEYTEYINDFLQDYWSGSTQFLCWKKLPYIIEYLDFPNEIEADIFDIKYLKENFKLFSEQKLVVYFSGMERCNVVSTDTFIINLYNLMDNFCYLDGVFLFSYNEILKKEIKNFCIEFKFFEHLYGIKK